MAWPSVGGGEKGMSIVALGAVCSEKATAILEGQRQRVEGVDDHDIGQCSVNIIICCTSSLRSSHPLSSFAPLTSNSDSDDTV